MNYFRGVGMFGSAFLVAHLMRGAAAAALLAWAIVHQTAHPWLSLGAGVAALVALRGCPMCWTVGLVETLSQGRRDSTIDTMKPAIATASLSRVHAGICEAGATS
jgi:AcrR family transcriptional regulator